MTNNAAQITLVKVMIFEGEWNNQKQPILEKCVDNRQVCNEVIEFFTKQLKYSLFSHALIEVNVIPGPNASGPLWVKVTIGSKQFWVNVRKMYDMP